MCYADMINKPSIIKKTVTNYRLKNTIKFFNKNLIWAAIITITRKREITCVFQKQQVHTAG